MVLSDYTIREEFDQGRLVIDPFLDELVQPAGYDIRLGTEFLTHLSGSHNPVVDPLSQSVDDIVHYERVVRGKNEPYFYLYPNGFVLGTTFERFSIPNDIVAFIDGKSSLARIGLMADMLSSNIAPGFQGPVTLGLYNITNRPIKLVPGMPIAQMYFMRLDRPSQFPYGTPGRKRNYIPPELLEGGELL